MPISDKLTDRVLAELLKDHKTLREVVKEDLIRRLSLTSDDDGVIIVSKLPSPKSEKEAADNSEILELKQQIRRQAAMISLQASRLHTLRLQLSRSEYEKLPLPYIWKHDSGEWWISTNEGSRVVGSFGEAVDELSNQK